MDKELKHGKTEQSMKVYGKMINNMVKVRIQI